MIKHYLYILLMAAIICTSATAHGQDSFKAIALPQNINSVDEEFSGMTMYNGRLYLLPQYGDHKETKLNGTFSIYSIVADSIGRVIDKKDTALTAYKAISVKKLNQLPDSVKANYEGFEAITMVNNMVYLSIETDDSYAYCFLLKGTFDTIKNTITIDPLHFVTLKRPIHISNAGFESVTWLPKEKKLLAYYEFNAAAKGGNGYLIDTSFNKTPEQVKTPFLYFRVTDIAATSDDKIYGINYFWNGDYNSYLNNDVLKNQLENIRKTIPDLNNTVANDPDYLKTNSYNRIVMLNNRKDKQWKQVTSTFPVLKNNWEGIALYRKGALIITDANMSGKQLSTFGYVEFE
ncbi:hypothetical protein SNE25_00365 [Mucilaginibacter sabulilitoris]|uniref:Uncharacterized protein n=1 Tax=Mucilaginibacter sabulilitoris TaxID=1173583 RepID=A0ABZ0TLE6_9SPHI|nr:hypothetical protein [Mucilaginibacter sabulilitoris]WPU93977.1 hypothetical protein SNE25_00365 [Mucilaginibacter sabulilitoris]